MDFPISPLEKVLGTNVPIETTDNEETDTPSPLYCHSVAFKLSSSNQESIEAPKVEQLAIEGKGKSLRRITTFECNQGEKVNIYNFCVVFFFFFNHYLNLLT